MSESNSLVIMGYSGHAYVVIETGRRMGLSVVGYLDRQAAQTNPFQLHYWGSEDELTYPISEQFIFPAVGDNVIRKRLVEKIREKEWCEVLLKDPTVLLSESASVALSTILMPRTSINSLARIGSGCIINTGAIIEHECSIGDYTHIAPGAVIAGNVTIGESCFVGAGAVIKQGVTIGKQVTIGAGTVVIHDIPNGGTWVGNPARQIK